MNPNFPEKATIVLFNLSPEFFRGNLPIIYNNEIDAINSCCKYYCHTYNNGYIDILDVKTLGLRIEKEPNTLIIPLCPSLWEVVMNNDLIGKEVEARILHYLGEYRNSQLSYRAMLNEEYEKKYLKKYSIKNSLFYKKRDYELIRFGTFLVPDGIKYKKMPIRWQDDLSCINPLAIN